MRGAQNNLKLLSGDPNNSDKQLAFIIPLAISAVLPLVIFILLYCMWYVYLWLDKCCCSAEESIIGSRLRIFTCSVVLLVIVFFLRLA